MARILVQISVLPQDLLWRQKGRLMLWKETNTLNLSVRRLLSKIESPKVDPSNQITAPKDDLLKILGLGENGTVPSDLKWTFDGYMVINGINQSRAFEDIRSSKDWTRFATATNFKTTFSMDGETVESVYSVKKDDADETTNDFTSDL